MANPLLPLTFAVAEHPHTRGIKSREIPIEGVAAEFVKVEPQIAAYRRMVRHVEFDVCELAPTTYIIARALGAAFVALPIFVGRGFHHGGLLVRPDAGIRMPRDLEGKRVGVRAYSVTTGVWSRGILASEFEVDCSKITWVVDDEEHVTSLKLPKNVVQAPERTSLVEMMAAGELSAGYAGNAGLGRSGKPTAGWDAKKIQPADYPDLFPRAQELEAEWYKRTGIYPIHGTVVVKESVLKEHPWVARSLLDAYSEAKLRWLRSMADGSAQSASDMKYRKSIAIVGEDPLPFGIEANKPSIDALERFAFEQGLTPRRMGLSELFVGM